MYLYDKKENKLDIYDLIPNIKELYEYRAEQMKQIPEKDMIIRGVTGTGIESYKILQDYENKFDTEILPIENVNGMFHKLEPDYLNNSETNRKKLLELFYSGYFINKKIARIQDLKKIRYLLLKHSEYRYYPGKATLDEIIEIPESLYLLSLIEQEKFSLIGNKNISEQLKLFKLEQTKSIDLDTLERIDYIGLAPDCYTKAIKKSRNDAHILKLMQR